MRPTTPSRKDSRKLARRQKSQRRAQFYAQPRKAQGNPPTVAAPQKRPAVGTANRPTASRSDKRTPSRAPPSDDESICSDDLGAVSEGESVESSYQPPAKKTAKPAKRTAVAPAFAEVMDDPLLAYAERAIDEGILGSDGEFDESRMDTLFGDATSESDVSDGDSAAEGDLYGRDLPSAKDSALADAPREPAAYTPPSATAAAYVLPNRSGAVESAAGRTIRGLLNRLAMTNLEGIVTSVVKLADEHPRGVVSEALSSAVMDCITKASRLQGSFVLAHAALVTALAHVLGVDIAGRVIEACVLRLDAERTSIASLAVADVDLGGDDEDGTSPLQMAVRAQRHTLMILGYMHALHSMSSGVIVGVIREAAVRICIAHAAVALRESDASAIVTVLRLSGAQLRREDPAALRVLLNDLSTQMASVTHASARLRFLVEAIDDMRNNKQRIVPATVNAEVESARKTLRAVLHAKGCGKLDPLAVTLEDIRGASTRGKWWVTGAAWRPAEKPKEASAPKAAAAKAVDVRLDALARKQGLTTDVRRAVFCALMSSEDYVDAHLRLSGLGLASRDEREIAHVIMHCVSREQKYNPFYALVALRFLALQHNFVVTFRHALWDCLRAMEDDGAACEVTVARFFGALIGHGALPLSILKRVSPAQASGPMVTFLRVLVASMLEAVARPSLDHTGSPVDTASKGDASARMASVLADLFKAQKSKVAASKRRRIYDLEDAMAASVMRGVSDSDDSDSDDDDVDFEEQQRVLLRRQELEALRDGLRLFVRMHMRGSLDGVPPRLASSASALVPMLIEMLECTD